MGKYTGFRMDGQRGGGILDLYTGGTNPNQEGGMMQTRHGGLSALNAAVAEPEDEEDGEIEGLGDVEDAAMGAVEEVVAAPRGRRVPTPPPPVRGERLYRGETHLQKTLEFLKMNKALKGGKKTRVHKRIEGWKLHGANAGDQYPGRLARPIRQGKILSLIQWKEGKENLNIAPKQKTINKYITAIGFLNEFVQPRVGAGVLLPRRTRGGPIRAPIRRRRKRKQKGSGQIGGILPLMGGAVPILAKLLGLG